MRREISINGGPGTVASLTRHRRGGRLWLKDGKSIDATLLQVGSGWLARTDGTSAEVSIAVERDEVMIHAFGRTWRVAVVDPAQRAIGAGQQSGVAKAPMPGTAIAVMVKVGDSIVEGQPLVIIESMKMQTEITASRAGVVDQVGVRVGDTFPLGAPLVTLALIDGEV